MNGDPESDNLVLRLLREMRAEMAEGLSSVRAEMATKADLQALEARFDARFDEVDLRLVKMDAKLNDFVGLDIPARVTKLEVEIAKLKAARG